MITAWTKGPLIQWTTFSSSFVNPVYWTNVHGICFKQKIVCYNFLMFSGISAFHLRTNGTRLNAHFECYICTPFSFTEFSQQCTLLQSFNWNFKPLWQQETSSLSTAIWNKQIWEELHWSNSFYTKERKNETIFGKYKRARTT